MCHCNYATAKTLIVRDGTCAYAHTDTRTETKKTTKYTANTAWHILRHLAVSLETEWGNASRSCL